MRNSSSFLLILNRWWAIYVCVIVLFSFLPDDTPNNSSILPYSSRWCSASSIVEDNRSVDLDQAMVNHLLNELSSLLYRHQYQDIVPVMQEVESLLVDLHNQQPPQKQQQNSRDKAPIPPLVITNQQLASFMVIKGQALIKLENYEEAKTAIKSALTLYPYDKKLWLLYGNLHTITGNRQDYSVALSTFHTLRKKFKDFTALSGLIAMKSQLGYYHDWEVDNIMLKKFLSRSCRDGRDNSSNGNRGNDGILSEEEEIFFQSCSVSSMESLEYTNEDAVESLFEYPSLIEARMQYSQIELSQISLARRHQLFMRSINEGVEGQLKGHKKRRLRIGFIDDSSSVIPSAKYDEKDTKKQSKRKGSKNGYDRSNGGLQVEDKSSQSNDDSAISEQREEFVCQAISHFDITENESGDNSALRTMYEAAAISPTPLFEFFFFSIQKGDGSESHGELLEDGSSGIRRQIRQRICSDETVKDDPNQSSDGDDIQRQSLNTSVLTVIDLHLPPRNATNTLSIEPMIKEIDRFSLDVLIDLSRKGSMSINSQKWFPQQNSTTSLIERILTYRLALLQLSFQDHALASLALPDTAVDYVVTDRSLAGIATEYSITEDRRSQHPLGLLPSSVLFPLISSEESEVLQRDAEVQLDPLLDKILFLASKVRVSELDPTMVQLLCNIIRSIPTSRLLLEEIQLDEINDIHALMGSEGIIKYRMLPLKKSLADRTKADLRSSDMHILQKKVKLVLEPLFEQEERRIHSNDDEDQQLDWTSIPKIMLAGGRSVKSRVADSHLLQSSLTDELGRVFSLKEYEDLAIAAIKGRRNAGKKTMPIDPFIQTWKHMKSMDASKKSGVRSLNMQQWSTNLQKMIESLWEISSVSLSTPEVPQHYHVIGTTSWKDIDEGNRTKLVALDDEPLKSQSSTSAAAETSDAEIVNTINLQDTTNYISVASLDEKPTEEIQEHKEPIPRVIFDLPMLLLKIGGAFNIPGWVNMYSQEYIDYYQPTHNLHVDIIRSHLDLSGFPNNSVSALFISYDGFKYLKTSEFLTAFDEWFRVIRPGGILFISTLDNEVLSRMYIDPTMTNDDKLHISKLLYGEQTHKLTTKKFGLDPYVLLYFLYKSKFCHVHRMKSFNTMGVPDIPESFYKGYIASMYLHASVCPKNKPEVEYDDFGMDFEGTPYKGYKEEDYN